MSLVYASEAFDTSYVGAAMGAFDSLMDLSLFVAPLLGVAALSMTGKMAYPFLVAVIPAILGSICKFGTSAGGPYLGINVEGTEMLQLLIQRS